MTLTPISLDFDKMYLLRDPLGDRALRLKYGTLDWLTKQTTNSLFTGGLPNPPHPLHLHGYMGSQPMDFLWSGGIPIVCISEAIAELLKAHQVTGWSTYPVEVYDKQGNILPSYLGFAVTGKVGKRETSLSKIVDAPIYKGSTKTKKVYQGFFFNQSSWDGSDFCVVEGTYFIVVTQIVYDIFKASKVNNVKLTPLRDVQLRVKRDGL